MKVLVQSFFFSNQGWPDYLH